MSDLTEASIAPEVRRIAALLDRDAPQMSAKPAEVTSAVRAAAAAVGIDVPARIEPLERVSPANAIAVLAARHGLVVHRVALRDALAGEPIAPLVVLSADGKRVASLHRRRGRTLIADEAGRWRFRACRPSETEGFGPSAFALTPGLPDRPVKPVELMRYGLAQARGDLLAFVAGTLIAGTLVALVPLAMAPLVSVVVPERDVDLLRWLGLFLVGAFVAHVGARYAADIAKLRVSGRIGGMLLTAAIDRALRIAEADARACQPSPPAPIAALATRMVPAWHRSIWTMALGLVAAVLLALPSLVVVALASPRASLSVFAAFALALFGAALIARRQLHALTSGLTAPQSYLSTAFESLSSIDTVRAGAAEDRFFTRFVDGFLSLRHRFLTADRVGAGGRALESAFEGSILSAAILGVALLGSQAQGAHTGSFVVAAGTVAGAGTALLTALASVSSLGLQRRLIDPLLAGTPVPRKLAAAPPKLTGRIQVLSATVRYGAAAPAVDKISLEIAPGEHLGIAGASGAGKSTLVKAMLGLVPLESGAVLYDGFDIEDLDQEALRRGIGVVGQMGRLFPGTLYDNVAAGLDLSQAEVMGALQQAGLAETVAALPLGLGTPVSDAEGVFSGGQVQRILLARALAGRPRILVLDEATSALDPAVQAHVSQSIDALDATVISIAHRVETLERCDRILVLDAGRIVEAGSFRALVAQGGSFARMVAAQQASQQLSDTEAANA